MRRPCGTVADRYIYKVLTGQQEKGQLGTPRYMWEHMKICFREIGWEGVYWINLSEDRN
jgi:hypothetical protein